MHLAETLGRVGRRSTGVAAAMLLVTVPAVVLASHQYNDVPTGHPFHAEIGAITKAGVSAGYGDGGFHPAEEVTRQAMAAFMHRGLGRAGVAVGGGPLTSAITAVANSSSSPYLPVRQLAITVPGTTNTFSPNQLVYVRGHVAFLTSMGPGVGCPCEFAAKIVDVTSGSQSVLSRQTFSTTSDLALGYALDIDALFTAPPGARTYRLDAALTYRINTASQVSFSLSPESLIGAMTFPFGPSGANTL